MATTRRGTKTRERILKAAGRTFRSKGLAASSVAEVMREADLTHGGFYLHFDSKEQLEAEAFETATGINRARWFAGLESREGRPQRLERLMRRYLNPAHRDDPGDGCPFASLGGEIAAGGSPEMRGTYETELKQSAAALADELGPAPKRERMDRALALLALCVGGLIMARAVRSPGLSNRILRACRTFAIESTEAIDKKEPQDA